MSHKTKVYLVYSQGQFHLDVQNGVNLWSGYYTDLNKALEFSRAYISNIQQTELVIDQGLSDSFYEQRSVNEQRFLFGV